MHTIDLSLARTGNAFLHFSSAIADRSDLFAKNVDFEEKLSNEWAPALKCAERVASRDSKPKMMKNRTDLVALLPGLSM